jgi:hypothetical protein
MARKERKYHYIYKITCLRNNRYYIGMHSTDDLEDGYMGGGKRIKNSVKKHGKDAHRKEILEFFENREDLKNREIQLVNEELLSDPMCMNLQFGGGGGFIDPEHQMKCSLAGAKSPGRTEKSSKKLRELLKDNEYKEKYKEKISEGRRGQPGNKAMLGKNHDIGTILKMKESHKKDKNSQFGTRWITNGSDEMKIKQEEIPEGWNLGRKKN